jgi:hypothetical protein
MPRPLHLLATVLLVSTPAAPVSGEPAYPLDAIDRAIPKTGQQPCPRVGPVAYRGDVVRYSPVIWVHPDFRARLAAFEGVVRDVGIEVYGRPPERIVQLGGYNCRRMRSHAGWLSEHALGNAIDVLGFDFGRLPKGAMLSAGVDPVLANGFEVRVQAHWAKKEGVAAAHARFLRALALRLIGREDVFRVLLGPGYPGHANHFHFDVAPWRMVQIFEGGRPLEAPTAAADNPAQVRYSAGMLVDDIKRRIHAALKAGNTVEKEVLRVLLGEIQTAEARGTAATDESAAALVRKLIKSNEETLAATADETAKRTLAEENVVLASLLPKSMGVPEIVEALAVLRDTIRAAGNDGQATGVAMKHLKASGAIVNGKDVTEAVKKLRAG